MCPVSDLLFWDQLLRDDGISALFTDAETSHLTAYEIFFIIFAVSFSLDEYTASREHGWESKFRDS